MAAKRKAGRARGGGRVYTPQEIIDYYRKNKVLPPEMQKRVEK